MGSDGGPRRGFPPSSLCCVWVWVCVCVCVCARYLGACVGGVCACVRLCVSRPLDPAGVTPVRCLA
eukprot:NODE_9649_length_311_cov_61.541985_g7881_i0.p2 GENE.NODE_9649_length_311_cov_61.541985_g7881_i0~~NODE_9649_length_311_cov_61.541985_g7881_i0.p2  ORF type:complete len:76 (+),score=24.99 NODE_9649_length_311_cov_61.541985_g7881_i0:32-229(+)